MNRAARQGESALETPHAWRELTCQEYEDAIRADDEAHVASSITDPDGVYGSPLTFTLWLMSDGSYLSTALEGRRDTEDYKCSHAASVPVLETPPSDEFQMHISRAYSAGYLRGQEVNRQSAPVELSRRSLSQEAANE